MEKKQAPEERNPCICCGQMRPLDMLDRNQLCRVCSDSGRTQLLKSAPQPSETSVLTEELAELEHEQWMVWSKSLISQLLDDISPFETVKIRDRVLAKHQRWLKLWKPYSELTEEEKEQDRIWARKVEARVLEKCREHEIKFAEELGELAGKANRAIINIELRKKNAEIDALKENTIWEVLLWMRHPENGIPDNLLESKAFKELAEHQIASALDENEKDKKIAGSIDLLEKYLKENGKKVSCAHIRAVIIILRALIQKPEPILSCDAHACMYCKKPIKEGNCCERCMKRILEGKKPEEKKVK